MMASAKKAKSSTDKAAATNRKARRDYHVLETFEAGIELRGTEVKSIRDGKVSLNESFAKVENDEVILYNMRVEPYEHGNVFNHDPQRPKKLLFHKSEIRRLFGQVAVKGHALIPIRLYFKRGIAKIEIGLCRGKHFADKRETLKRKTAEREAERAIAGAKRRK